ncbi:uncharacterized protein LOC103309388 [Acyrthosiphon pisum]|uniref:SWIM-type domain-containing protein n=1 Tax=Acyrthosiphon pisum TaxID=7029 RepID=A0A8R2F813_ACYPI|nr:uncharacterized protein LOC103309388 [Acyrthosiphon pisum]|eukprot:XP_008182907.1 PREDICTED: uncharacterized protein LOC103309388 [Acyrthosiphon pisum]
MWRMLLNSEGVLDEEFTTLKKNDFALGYMDHNQEHNLMRYGYKTICFDGTHGTNPNDFILHTILVTDVDCGGYPVAFLLSNRNDEVFMKQKLFCTWHVHKAWRKNFLKINNKKKRVTVRKILYDLSTELDEEEFKNKLYTFLSNNDEDLQNFLDYFFKYYSQNPQYWAYCDRQYAGCNTNMDLESFHRVLKEKIICRLKVTIVYNCLCYLEKYLTMKDNDIQKKQIRTKRTNKLKVLRINHKKIEIEPKCSIKPLSFNSWHIESFTDEKYTLCPDHSIRNNMCKHIHAVCMYNLNNEQNIHLDKDKGKNNTEIAQDQQPIENMYQNQVEHLESARQTHQVDDILLDHLRNKILKEIEQSLQNVKTKDQLQQINRKLIAPIHAFVSASNVETVPLTKNKSKRGKMALKKRIFDKNNF